MQNPSFATATPTKFRRHDGPVGGVAAGLGHTFGIEAGYLRLAFTVAAILMGPIIVAAYVGLWYLMPVDQSVPVEHRPDSPPIALVIILALMFGLGFVFDFAFGVLSLVSAIPFWAVIAVGAIWLIARSKK